MKKGLFPVAVPLFYLLLSAAYTYPLFFLGSGGVYGLQEDITRSLNDFWCFAQNGDWMLNQRSRPQLNAPFGQDYTWLPEYLYHWTCMALAAWAGPFSPTNWVIALSFPLGGWFFYLLAHELTGSRIGALLGGVLYMFCPWHFAKAEAYPDMASIQWIPLYAWRLAKFLKAPGPRHAWLAGLCFILLFNFSYVLGFMTALFAALTLFLAWRSLSGRTPGKVGAPAWMALGASHLPAFLGIAGYKLSLLGQAMPGASPLLRKPQAMDLWLGGVRWEHFFLPTYYHPLWGKIVHQWMGTLKPGTWYLEDIVHPGYVALMLSAILIFRAVQKHGLPENRLWLSIAAGTGLAAWMCWSPVFGRLVMPFPNALLYVLFPTFRFMSRFGILLALGTALMSSMAVALWERGRKRGQAVLGASIVAAAVCFELYCPTVPRVYDVSDPPPEYRWLKEKPGDPIVAEYPLVTERLKFEPLYLLWQIHHGKRLFNADYQHHGNVDLHRQVAYFRSPATVCRLQGFGVRYMVIHKVFYISELIPSRDPRWWTTKMRLPETIGPARRVLDTPQAGIYEIPPVSRAR